jgi:hypothetical protein
MTHDSWPGLAGARQREHVPRGLVPRNHDSEVIEHQLLPIHDALQCAARVEMTIDAALTTPDLALRHVGIQQI